MRRALSFPAVAVAAAVGVLVPPGLAAADTQPLFPGQMQALSVPLAPGDWSGRVPGEVTVEVTRLVQLENGCLEPEDDKTCLAEQGELADQLWTTVAPGVTRSGECEARGPQIDLDLREADPVELTLRTDQDWDDVDCLSLELTFRNLVDNNRAQSDSVVFDLRTTARELRNEPTGDDTTPSGNSSTDTGASPTDNGGTPAGTDGTAAGTDADGLGGPAATVGSPGGPGGAGPAVAGGAPLAPTSGDGSGEVIGQSDSSVTVGGDGAAVETQAAESSLLGTALAWGGVFVGALALGWFLFLVVRRRRRTERAA